MTRYTTIVSLLVLTATFAGAQSAPPAASPPASETQPVEPARGAEMTRIAEQLTAHARHIGASGFRTGVSSTARSAVWLDAALRLDPEYLPALIQRVEMTLVRADDERQSELLETLLKLYPEHTTVIDFWLERQVQALQSSEERQRRLLDLLGDPKLSGALHASVCLALADMSAMRFDEQNAAAWLRRALEFDADAPAVIEAHFDWSLKLADAPTQIRAAAKLLHVAPQRSDAAWHAAQLLANAGLHEEASYFFEHAVLAEQRGVSPPMTDGRSWLALARHLVHRSRVEPASEVLERAATDPTTYLAAVELKLWLLRSVDDGALADDIQREAAEEVKLLENPEQWPAPTVARAAWFALRTLEDPALAAKLARSAYERDKTNPFTQRVYAWTLSDAAPARALLEPLGRTDPWAAIRLAELAAEPRGNAIQDLLRTFPPARAVGGLREALMTAWERSGLDPAAPIPAANAALREAARTFDSRITDVLANPRGALHVSAQFFEPSVGPADPWRVALKLENRSPFPLHFRFDGLFQAAFLLSYELEGDRQRRYPATKLLTVPELQVLAPGESRTFERDARLGPPRSASDATPQQLQRITLSLTFDPLQTADGRWSTGPMGARLDDLFLNRTPARTGPGNDRARRRDLMARNPQARRQAIVELAQLLGEHQRVAAGMARYAPDPIDVGVVTGDLARSLLADDPGTRLDALLALQVCGLDQRMLKNATRCLEHPSWLVRLAALDLVARQGPRVGAQVQQVLAQDPDPLVKQLARGYLVTWAALLESRTPANAPTETPAATSGSN